MIPRAQPHFAVLMYHRVCSLEPQTAPYFARGTAVRIEHFEAQLRWLSAHCEVCSLGDLHVWLAGGALTAKGDEPPVEPGRTKVILTFDDAFRDCLTVVAPRCAALCMPWTVFPIARHTGDSARACWTDDYYALLSQRRPASALRPLRWWVRGPFRVWLDRQAPEQRAETLLRLAAAWGLGGGTVAAKPANLYCTRAELRALLDAGAEVGGHGGLHQRLAEVSDEALLAELADSEALLRALHAPMPRFFCHPDGSHDARTRAAIAAAGICGAFSVEPGLVSAAADPYALPRHIVRDRPPDDAHWCAAFQNRETASDQRAPVVRGPEPSKREYR
jgi:peptidoglycan/xylan/chitin deacetylase (PgdA/CDA1 family)